MITLRQETIGNHSIEERLYSGKNIVTFVDGYFFQGIFEDVIRLFRAAL